MNLPKEVVEKAYAKINLSIDITGKREDGYHEIRMIMQTVDLHDTVTVRQCTEGISISCKSPFVPIDQRNVAWKAAKLFFDKYQVNAGVSIRIDKTIPVAAGLAGGSANAAAVLRAMRTLFKPDITDEELRELSKSIGADVAYCVSGGTMLAEGIGDTLTPLPSLKSQTILLVKPGIGVSTPQVYHKFILEDVKERPNIDKMIKDIKAGDMKAIAKNMVNVLETVTIKDHPVIKKIKDGMVERNCLGCVMSGSGPSVVGIFEDDAAAEQAFAFYARQPYDVFLTKTT
ncbi:MAG: 4-(cytidine 5'-diphospho)-2-C-methyl-D-erythritol kinase [Clostridia bacterium]